MVFPHVAQRRKVARIPFKSVSLLICHLFDLGKHGLEGLYLAFKQLEECVRKLGLSVADDMLD